MHLIVAANCIFGQHRHLNDTKMPFKCVFAAAFGITLKDMENHFKKWGPGPHTRSILGCDWESGGQAADSGLR